MAEVIPPGRPTERAKELFDIADKSASVACNLFFKNAPSQNDLKTGHYYESAAIVNLAQGLGNLAAGLRATYMLLEEVKKQLESARTSRPLPGQKI
jgi:hypothetical protein